MYWTLELASYLEDAPWPATRDELIDYAIRSGAPLEVIENLQEMDFMPILLRIKLFIFFCGFDELKMLWFVFLWI